jgi:cysteine desulfuration protein SufE
MNNTLETLLSQFELLTEWEDRYRLLIEIGNSIDSLDETDKIEVNQVQGCMSQVWMVIDRVDDNAIFFRADSNSVIVKGLIVLLLGLYSGHSPREIMAIDVDSVFNKMGLNRHLSPNRRNGFYSMVLHLKNLAVRVAMENNTP